MKLFHRHVHEWGPWRVMLMSLTDSPVAEPAREARHCASCRSMQTRRRIPEGEQE